MSITYDPMQINSPGNGAEQTLSWNKMIYPDSDENVKKLQEMIDQIHLMEELLSDEMNDCPICGLKRGEKTFQSPFVPSMCWLETSRAENGYIQMKFGYGDDFEHIFYTPKYCPECGRKNEKQD